MPLRFSSLSTLLSDLESYASRDPPLLKARLEEKSKKRIINWFTSYRITSSSTDLDLVALVSVLFPERRKDRVYGLKSRRLSRTLRRVLHLGSGRWPLLEKWQEPGYGDLADCVERVLKQAEFPKQPVHREVTLEQVDAVLSAVAQKCRFSGPQVRSAPADPRSINELLESIFCRLQSNEAKWFTRLLLTEYPPMFLPEVFVLGIINRHLPAAIRMYDNLQAAFDALKGSFSNMPRSSDSLGTAAQSRPRIGIKVGRPQFLKARSVKHACRLAKHREMCLQRKYDGEYCQIHVDLSEGDHWIRIFSKSGKDSTQDRSKLHENVREALRIGQHTCAISQKCILEGEMVIWDNRVKEVSEFCKIRKHISRSGTVLGTKEDSQAHDHESLMIFFYDVMMIDDEPILERPYYERRIHLERLIKPLVGQSGLAQSEILDFSKVDAIERLRGHLAEAFAKRWEGLVMKPADESYFGSGPDAAWVKMKKDYIPGLGDTADIAVVGASYDQAAAGRVNYCNLKWTHFHLGCLFNKEEVLRGKKPYFAVIDTVSWGLKVDDVKTLNDLGVFPAVDASSSTAQDLFKWYAVPTLPRMAVIFRKPFALEVMGGGFDKPGDSDWYTLRWPRVLKIHHDRDWKDAVDLEQLQQLALEARTVPDHGLLEEIHLWSKRLGRISNGLTAPPVETQEGEKQPLHNGGAILRSLPNLVESPLLPDVAPAIVLHQPSKQEIAPMIRMDSNEMRPGEHRVESGKVSMRPSSRNTEKSLLTPPHSSPLVSSCAPKRATHLECRTGNIQARSGDVHAGLHKAIVEPCQNASKLANMKTYAEIHRKRFVPHDHSPDDHEDVILGYVAKRIHIRAEDRRKMLETGRKQTPLRECINGAFGLSRISPSVFVDPLLEPQRQQQSFLVSKIAVATRESRTKKTKPALQLSSPGDGISEHQDTSQDTTGPKTPPLRIIVNTEADSPPSVIPETPQHRICPQRLAKMPFQKNDLACILGHTIDDEHKTDIRKGLKKLDVPSFNLPPHDGYRKPWISAPSDLFEGKHIVFLRDGNMNGESNFQRRIVNYERSTFLHCLQYFGHDKASVWHYEALRDEVLKSDKDTFVVDDDDVLGEVVLTDTKQATFKWASGDDKHYVFLQNYEQGVRIVDCTPPS